MNFWMHDGSHHLDSCSVKSAQASQYYCSPCRFHSLLEFTYFGGLRIFCMPELFFLISYCRVCKKKTPYPILLFSSCKYFGHSHQLYLDRKHFAHVTTATLEFVSTSEAKMSKFSVSWDFWVINTC